MPAAEMSPEELLRQLEETKGELRELRQKEKRFRALLDTMQEGCQIIGHDWTYLYLNEAAEKQNRRPNADLLGQKMTEAWPGIEESEIFLLLNRSMEERIPLQQELEFVFPDGSSGWYNVKVQPVDQGIFVTHIDISSYRAGQESLLEKNRFIESILNFTPDLIYVYDLVETRNVFSNKGIETVLGFTPEEIKTLGEQVLGKLMHPEDLQTYLRDTLPRYAEASDGVPISHTYRFRHKHGDWRWLEFEEYIYKRLPDGSPKKVFGVAHDITEKLTSEEHLRQVQKLEAIGSLAGGVAHDFNNLLSIILGYAENLADNLGQANPLREDVMEIINAGRRSADLTRQLLAFSRKQTLQTEVLDLNGLVSNLEKMLRRLIGENILLDLHYSGSPLMVRVDPGQIEQVIMNLAINSRDALPGGGTVTLETGMVELDTAYTMEHPGSQPGKYVLLSISDDGCGMDPLTLERIFEPFFTTKELGRGTGMGLATVYGIVKQTGGNIWVYSEPGEGTTFKVYLPLVQGADEKLTAMVEEQELGGRGEHLLIVDDDSRLRRVFARMLTGHGYTVTTAKDGSEALELVQEQGLKPDCVVTDVIMPGMSGAELIERLRLILPDLPYLYMSGYTDDTIALQGVLEPGIPFIQKPFNASKLSAKVQEVLRRAQE